MRLRTRVAVVATTSALTLAGAGMAASAVGGVPSGAVALVDGPPAVGTRPWHGLVVTTEPTGSTRAAARQAAVTYGPRDDGPRTIPIGTPIALVFIAAALIFIPSLFS